MDKLKSYINKLFLKIPKTAPGASMKYIIWYAFILMLCVGLYLVMVCYDWYSTGKPNISEMREFISTLISGSAMAAIGFVCRFLVDSNGDGVPDAVEKEVPEGGEGK